MTDTAARAAWGWGLATITRVRTGARHLVPDAPALGAARRRATLPGARRRRSATTTPRRPHRSCRLVEIDLDAPPADTSRRLPAPAPAQPSAGRPASSTSTASSARCPNVVWTSRRPVRGRRLRDRPRPCARPRGEHLTVFGVDKFPRMVDYVLPDRRADRRRRPRAARRAPGRGHDGHARGLRQLQRRHARRLHGRGADLGRRRGRRRLRRRRRRLDHGHAVRRRQRGRSRSASAACSARTPASASRSGDDCVVEAGLYVTAGTEGHPRRRARWSRRRELSGRVRPAVPAQLGDRRVEVRPRQAAASS